MNALQSVKAIGKKVTNMVLQNEPTIMAVTAMGGVVVTGGLAAKGGIGYAREVDHIEDELDKYQKVGLVAKHFWPAFLMGAVDIALIFAGNKQHLARNAALVALAATREQDLKRYKEGVEKAFGEKKAGQVHDQIAKDILEDHPVDEELVINTNGGNVLCYDTMSGRYFRSSMAVIQSAENELNRKMISDYTASLNDFYDLIGLDGIEAGEDLGWNTDQMLRIDFSSQVSTNGQPCLVIDYITRPRWCFR